MIKKLIFISVLFSSFCSFSFSQTITRGPDFGEIYILGLSKSGLEATIYHSTDFGETIECMDSISQNTYWIETIEADKTAGRLYFVTALGGLHYSSNYGQYGSWDFRQADISWNVCAGIVEGQIYNTFNSHSNDYGITFYSHQANGFFGGLKYTEIDVLENNGYVLVNKWGVSDSVYLLKTNDNFENLVLDTVYNFGYSDNITLSHSIEEGELFMFNTNSDFSKLWYSNNFANNWVELNSLNFKDSDIFRKGFECGQTNGELYFVLHFVSSMWQDVNSYILYSIDYGISFNLYHPLSYGEQPLLSNFSAKAVDNEVLDLESCDSVYYVNGEMPLNVQFYNYSIGNIITYEWDFNNDGEIDSYELSPTYTYADTGWYSINLTVYNENDTNSFFRKDYVFVYIATGLTELSTEENIIHCYPNPFSEKIEIYGPHQYKRINIYDINGRLVKTLKPSGINCFWDGKDISGTKCNPGIYFIKLSDNSFTQKIVLTY